MYICKKIKDMEKYYIHDDRTLEFKEFNVVRYIVIPSIILGIVIGIIISLLLDIMVDKPIPKEVSIKVDTIKHNVTATCYRATMSECDSSPLITADGSKINLNKLESGELRWCAISRDLEKHYNMGDTIIVSGIGGNYDGLWVIRDRMAKRWEQKIDFLISENNKGNLFKNVLIYKK